MRPLQPIDKQNSTDNREKHTERERETETEIDIYKEEIQTWVSFLECAPSELG